MLSKLITIATKTRNHRKQHCKKNLYKHIKCMCMAQEMICKHTILLIQIYNSITMMLIFGPIWGQVQYLPKTPNHILHVHLWNMSALFTPMHSSIYRLIWERWVLYHSSSAIICFGHSIHISNRGVQHCKRNK